jgi:hypothetical protein
VLYHVSFQTVKNNRFFLRIPKSRAPKEDSFIKRICFARTIEKCISAMPTGGKALDTLLKISEFMAVSPIIQVYTIKESDLPAENIWETQKVKQYVEDAECTSETWVVGMEVRCRHEIKLIERANIVCGVDKYGNEMFEVREIEMRTMSKLPETAPEKLFAPVIRGTSIDLRGILAKIDDNFIGKGG